MSEDRKTEQDVLRELDAAIAERVMGWVRVTGQTALAPFAYRRPDGHIVHPYSAPEYSSKIEAAMEVVGKIRERGLDVAMESALNTWEVIIWSNEKPQGKAECETLPEAICRAALHAMKCLSISDRGNDEQAS